MIQALDEGDINRLQNLVDVHSDNIKLEQLLEKMKDFPSDRTALNKSEKVSRREKNVDKRRKVAKSKLKVTKASGTPTKSPSNTVNQVYNASPGFYSISSSLKLEKV